MLLVSAMMPWENIRVSSWTLGGIRKIGLQIRLSNDIASFGCDHYSLCQLRAIGVLYSFQHASWDTCCPFDAGTVIKFAVIIRWAILNPVALKE